MDFIKVLNQTIRDIKREVNIKLLKVPEIEQKVLDATSNEPWGPHGSALAEIAQATKKFSECLIVMNVLWTRLTDNGRNWRHVHKALAVIEYLVAHGSERAVDDIIEHSYQISALSGFKYVEPNGKDMGINVRKRAETILSLLSDSDKIQEVRDKAAANHDKYFGLSSNGIKYKSSSTSQGSNSFLHNGRYGGLSGTKEGEMFKDGYKSCRSIATLNKTNDAKNESREHDASLSSTSRAFSKFDQSVDASAHIPSQDLAAPIDAEDDFDDFDPRGTSTAEKVPVCANEVGLFGNFMAGPTPPPPKMNPINGSAPAEVDLFANTGFVCAAPDGDAGVSTQAQANVDLFASHPASRFASSSPVLDFFASSEPVLQAETKTVDPFAGVPLNSFNGSDAFGAFISKDQVTAEPTQIPVMEPRLENLDEKTSTESKPLPEKDRFQVKSGIWADTLSRGLVDLNITAPKKTKLADIGIVGGHSDGTEDKEKVGHPSSAYRAMVTGSSNGGRSGFNSAEVASEGDILSALTQ